ncbi:MAG: hypothetical protein OXE44_11115 [Nitrospinae bacterium]|nr:hypothetical protein [Nitrospinota bacterium]
MKPTREQKEREIDDNLEFFLAELPRLKQHHFGKFALLKNKELVAVFDTPGDAQTAGARLFEGGLFSIQKIDDTPVSLGSYSHAVHLG